MRHVLDALTSEIDFTSADDIDEEIRPTTHAEPVKYVRR